MPALRSTTRTGWEAEVDGFLNLVIMLWRLLPIETWLTRALR
jgi:hypothetical protein